MRDVVLNFQMCTELSPESAKYDPHTPQQLAMRTSSTNSSSVRTRLGERLELAVDKSTPAAAVSRYQLNVAAPPSVSYWRTSMILLRFKTRTLAVVPHSFVQALPHDIERTCSSVFGSTQFLCAPVSALNDGRTRQQVRSSAALASPHLTPPADLMSHSDRLAWHLSHSSKEDLMISTCIELAEVGCVCVTCSTLSGKPWPLSYRSTLIARYWLKIGLMRREVRTQARHLSQQARAQAPWVCQAVSCMMRPYLQIYKLYMPLRWQRVL
jgi:hypothetical protein